VHGREADGLAAHLLHTVERADVIQRVHGGRQTAVQAEDLPPPTIAVEPVSRCTGDRARRIANAAV
jgi:hypothetical protein